MTRGSRGRALPAWLCCWVVACDAGLTAEQATSDGGAPRSDVGSAGASSTGTGGSSGVGSGGGPASGGSALATGGDRNVASAGQGGDVSSGPVPEAGVDPSSPRIDAGAGSDEDPVVGWAGVAGDGVETTTGGADGDTVTPTSAQELIEFAQRSEPLVILVEGTFSVPRLEVSSDKTLVGVGPDALIAGGIAVRGSDGAPVTNVIVRNLRVGGGTSGADGDALQIYYAHHVWVDHCEIYDAPDGNLDIVHASNWVTVSWTKFRYSADAPAPDHRFSNLVGHSDSNVTEDTGRLKVTFHHDWWADGVVERMPRVRFGDVHVFNSYFSARGNNYAVGAGYESRLLLENNFFEGVNDAHVFYDGEVTAEIVAVGNVYEDTAGARDVGQGSAFDPPYPYSLESAEGVRDAVTRGAGPR